MLENEESVEIVDARFGGSENMLWLENRGSDDVEERVDIDQCVW